MFIVFLYIYKKIKLNKVKFTSNLFLELKIYSLKIAQYVKIEL